MGFAKRRKFSIVLSLVLVFTMLFGGSSVFAEGNGEEEAKKQQDINMKVGDLVTLASENPLYFGLEDVDFSNVYIGNEIIPSILKDGKITYCNYKYYPIYSNNEVVAIATAVFDKNSIVSVQLGKDFAEELQSTVNQDNSLALVYSENQLYASNREEATLLSNFITEEYQENSDIQSFSSQISEIEQLDLSKLKMTKIYPTSKIVIPTDTANYRSSVRASSSNQLSVPIKLQGGQNICWAACVASIGQYKTGGNLSAMDICFNMNVPPREGATSYTVKKALLENYNISSTVYETSPTFDKINSNINNRKPLYTRANSNTYTAGHAVVACGYGSSAQTAAVYYMDPNYANIKITTNVTSSKFTFVSGEFEFYSNGYVQLN